MQIRRFCPRDAEGVSALIQTSLQETNARDYTASELAAIIARYTPAGVAALAQSGHLYVALDGHGWPAGCGAICPHESDRQAAYIHAMFVLPALQGQGVGRRVMLALENDMLAKNATEIHLNASLTAEGFYKRLGYTYPGGTRTITQYKVIPMYKRSTV